MVGPVEPIMVKALPATPAMPQPRPKGVAIDFLGVDADRAGHDAVLHDGADLAAPARLVHDVGDRRA